MIRCFLLGPDYVTSINWSRKCKRCDRTAGQHKNRWWWKFL